MSKKNKDPRWHKVNGLTISLNIIHGRMKKINPTLESHIASYLYDLRDRLIKEINADKA